MAEEVNDSLLLEGRKKENITKYEEANDEQYAIRQVNYRRHYKVEKDPFEFFQ